MRGNDFWKGQPDRPPAVWAPRAARVELVAGGCERSMGRRNGGWWVAHEPLPAGTDYAFRLDGEGPFPDPRSPWQPAGVDGPSRIVDHEAFRWRHEHAAGLHLPSALLYELHVGTFTPAGTLDAAVGRLDHLVELGVSAVSLMPVASFPGRHGWGYDGVAIWAVHEPYGGPDALKRFVDACHGRGLAVVLDVVYNHLGPLGNHLARYGPYFTSRYETPWGEAVNFDGAGSDEVRAFFIENALTWLRDYRIDGLRLDAVHAIVDASAVHVLEELAEAVEVLEAEVGRPLRLIAESDLNDPRLLWSREAGGYGLHAQWSDDFHHALHVVLTGERDGYYEDFGSLGDVAMALERAYVYEGRLSVHRGRRHGRPAAGLRGSRFLGYLQNHDQIGNRALGERLSHLVSPGLLRIGAALLLTSPFVPMLFQGEEWGAGTVFQYFTDFPDPHLAEAVRNGRRAEFAAFGWDPAAVPDPQDPDTFRHSVLDWSEPGREPHRGILEWHHELIALRRARPELTDGRLERVRTRVVEEARTLVVERGAVAVVCNLSSEERRVSAPAGRVLLTSDESVGRDEGGWRVPSEAVVVIETHAAESASERQVRTNLTM